MCGISAYLGSDRNYGQDFINRANRLLAHRGPDGKGEYFSDSVALGHTRLAIQDLSQAGQQPIFSDNGRYVLVFNGEIYNHLELRKKYLSSHSFQGHSDTETLLQLLVQKGVGCLELLVGMWAFAFWDQEAERLIICRDRFGQKPLYYRKLTAGYVFSSEIKPLLIEGERNAMNPTAVVEYLALGNYGHLGDQTFFKDIFQLLPATYAIINKNDKQVKSIKYWQIPVVEEKNKIKVGPKEVADFKMLLQEAVESQLISDVEVGATLSGGIDSSIIVGMLANTNKIKTPISIFTAQAANSRWDESTFVKDVESKWGKEKLKLHWKELKQTSISETLSNAIKIQEEPFGDPSIIAHGLLMDLAKKAGVKVILGGQGADELFLGYPSSAKNLISYNLKLGNYNWVKENIKNLKIPATEVLRIGLGAFLPDLERKARLNSRVKRRAWIDQDLLSSVDESSINLAKANDLTEIWNESFFGVHLPHLVHYDDRNSMSRSIEGRMPFLDHRLLDSLALYQSEALLQGGVYKSLLRSSCGNYLPESILKRRDKIGFFTPIHELIRNDITWIEQHIERCFFLDKEVLRQDVEFYKGKENSNIRSERLWRSLSLLVWIETFNVTLA